MASVVSGRKGVVVIPLLVFKTCAVAVAMKLSQEAIVAAGTVNVPEVVAEP